jgi:HTH-type transcriptional regulator/antitoxin HigA
MPSGDRLDVLATLFNAYESEHFPIDPPDPIEAIKFRVAAGVSRAPDLEAILGTTVTRRPFDPTGGLI